MDRFEVSKKKLSDYLFIIYIPVWIDLKESVARALNWQGEIYIPVWIDLKGKILETATLPVAIYIPVWIDLKPISFELIEY